MIGELFIEGDLNVNGTVEGQLQATGDVDVAQAANVKASVAGREVSISGQVNGAVTASKKLVVERSGSLVGDVRVPRLVIQDGAKFSGNVSMGPVRAEAAPSVAAPEAAAEPAAQPEKESAPVDKAKPKKR
jgi:cytoskeletal protein CcmA (bactofilin family)